MTEWIVSSSVLIVLMALLRRALKGKLNPRLQYALWAIVLVRLLVPVSFGDSPLSILNFQPPRTEWSQIAEETPSASETTPIIGTETDRVQIQTGTVNQNTPQVQEQQTPQIQTPIVQTPVEEVQPQQAEQPAGEIPPISPELVLTVIWVLGMAAMTGAFVGSNFYFAQQLRRSRVSMDVVYSPVEVYVTNLVETPCLFGMVKPAIYLTPEAWENEQVRRYVLTHEITHYQQFDHVWATLRAVCLVLHWYNPLVWLAFRLSRQDGEMACDEGTLEVLGEEHRGNYGRTLIALATQSSLKGTLVTATTLADSKKAMKERIVILMKKPKTALITLIALILICGIVVGCTFTGSVETTGPEENPIAAQHPLNDAFVEAGFEYVQGEPWEETHDTGNGEVTYLICSTMYYRYVGSDPQIRLDALDGVMLTLPEEWLDQVYVIQRTCDATYLDGEVLVVSRSTLQAHQENAAGEVEPLDGMYDYLFQITSQAKSDLYYTDDPRSKDGYIGENDDYLYFLTTSEDQKLDGSAIDPEQVRGMISIPDQVDPGDTTPLFQFGTGDSNWRYMATMSIFDDPKDIDLFTLFYNGLGNSGNDLTDEERAYLLDHMVGLYTDVDRLPASELDGILNRVFGVSLADVTIPESFVYYPETDCYYHQHGDVLIPSFSITYVERTADTIVMYYDHGDDSPAAVKGEYPMGQYEYGQSMVMTLHLVDGVWQVASNQLVSDQTTEENLDYTPLTQEQIDQVNEAFAHTRTYQEGTRNTGYPTPVNGFFRCYYSTPEEIDLKAFLRHFSAYGIVDGWNEEAYTISDWSTTVTEEEFQELTQMEEWWLDGITSLEQMPVPVHKMKSEDIDAVIYHYSGVHLDELNATGVDSGMMYSGKFDAYYNFTSDYDPGHFTCTGGRIYDGYVELYSSEGVDWENVDTVLTLVERDGRYYIQSYVPVKWVNPVALTEDQIAQVNEAFQPVQTDSNGESVANPISSFFTSYYEDPTQIDLVEFLRYFSAEGYRFWDGEEGRYHVWGDDVSASEEEFQALRKKADFPYTNAETLADMPVPVHKIEANFIDQVLLDYTEYWLNELEDAGKDLPGLYYLEEYDAYYNCTSDAGFGTFVCIGGTDYGTYIELYSEDAVLTLSHRYGTYAWMIYSHLPRA